MEYSRAPQEQFRRRLRRAADQAVHDLVKRHRMIGAMGQVITSEINFELLFELIAKQICDLMQSETCSVFLHDPDSNELWSLVSLDCPKNGIRFPAHCGIAGWVFEHRIPQIVHSPYDDPRFFQRIDLKTGFRTRNILCVPLLNRNSACIGTLQALNRLEALFTEQDLEVMLAASHYVTIALENAKLYEELKETDKVKIRVIHHLSHELKTPLAILKGALHLIRSKVSAEELRKIENTLDRGVRSLDRLKELQMKTDDILQQMNTEGMGQEIDPMDIILDLINEIEEENPDAELRILEMLKKKIEGIGRTGGIHKEMIDLSELLTGVCKSVIPMADRRNINLTQHIDHHLRVFTDEEVLRKVCAGILKNAMENTPDEGCIEVAARSEDDEIRIVFRDYGVGIDKENQGRIFSCFCPTQAVEMYASKMPYYFNAGGTGMELFRIKTFSDELNFRVDFSSRRCQVIEKSGKECPGRVSRCPFVNNRSQCMGQGGSIFNVRFPRRDGPAVQD